MRLVSWLEADPLAFPAPVFRASGILSGAGAALRAAGTAVPLTVAGPRRYCTGLPWAPSVSIVQTSYAVTFRRARRALAKNAGAADSPGMSRPKELILLLGGARSGKSRKALQLAETQRDVLFVATAEPRDDEMQARIAAHRRERPAGWTTLEEPVELAAALAHAPPAVGTVVLDCLTLWVSNLLLLHPDDPAADATILAEAEKLLDRYKGGTATWIVVSNEVGLGLVPDTELGRRYRDILGAVNQRFAERADRVLLMVAGIAVDVKRLGGEELGRR
jgi:adenosylcobinamide kinase/adenosylcobinamide-phosphate guanylyltransferase